MNRAKTTFRCFMLGFAMLSVYETELLEIALDTAHTSGEMVFQIEPEVEGGTRLHLTMIDPVPLCQAGPANSVWVLP